MGNIFTNKKFSNYLGENRAILDIITDYEQGVVPSPTPTPTISPSPTSLPPTPTSSFTPTPTTTPSPTPTPSVISTKFNIGLGFDNRTNAVFVDNDESIFIGGVYLFYDNVIGSDLVKLNSLGQKDPTFVSGLAAPFTQGISCIGQSSDPDEIFIGGDFTQYFGVTTQRFTKINKITGAQVSGWSGTNAANAVTNLLVDGSSVVIIGPFSQYKGVNRNRIARILSDNTVDTTIFSGTNFNNQAVNKVIKNNAGNYVVVGNFTLFNGLSVNRIIEIDSVTGLNTGLFGSGMNQQITDITYDSVTGNYYVLGIVLSTSYQGGPVSYLKVINDLGVEISTVNPVPNSGILRSMKVDFTNGFIYISSTQTDARYFRVVLSTLLADASFNSNLGTINNANVVNGSECFGITSTGKIYMAGAFTQFFTTQNYNFIVRVNIDGTDDTTNT